MTRLEIAARAETLLPEALSTAFSRFSAICDMTTDDVLEYVGLSELPDDTDAIPKAVGNLAADLAVYRWGLCGVESVSSEAFGGASTQYDHDIPPRLQRALCRVRKLRW